MKPGDLVTPTGRLVLPAGELKSEAWLQARRWRFPSDIDPKAVEPLPKSGLDREDPRGYRIGSSDVPSILDLEGVDTPAHVYRAKVYDVRPEVNDSMIAGTIFEDAIAMEWCRRNHAVIDEIGLVAKDGAPWHQSTIDRRVRECPVYPERSKDHAICGLEVKFMERSPSTRWHKELPDRIFAQMLHQLYVTGFEHMHYVAKVPGAFKQGIVWADRETKVMDYLVGEVERFRNEHLLTGVEPAWNYEKAEKMLELDDLTHPERVGEVDIEGVGEVIEYAGLSAAAGEADRARKAASARLRELANGAQVITFSGQRAFWYSEGHKPKVDLDRLKERHPDAYEDCVTETTYPILNIDAAYKVKKGGKK